MTRTSNDTELKQKMLAQMSGKPIHLGKLATLASINYHKAQELITSLVNEGYVKAEPAKTRIVYRLTDSDALPETPSQTPTNAPQSTISEEVDNEDDDSEEEEEEEQEEEEQEEESLLGRVIG